MKKDISVMELLERLKLIIDFTRVEIVDYWDADLCAIGLKRGDKLIYISTFNYIQTNDLYYDYDLEILNEEPKKYTVIEIGREVCELELFSKIKLHLGPSI